MIKTCSLFTRRLFAVQIAIAALILTGLIFFGTNQLVQDERFHVPTAQLLFKNGFRLTPSFLNFESTYGSNPGPLYAVTHVLFSKFTELNIKKMRFLNAVFFMMTVFVFSKTMMKGQWANSFLKAGTLFFIPSVFATSGLAVTEGPAILFLAIGCYLLRIATETHFTNLVKQAIFFVLSGLAFGVSVAGRQTFFLIFPATLIFLLNARTRSIIFLWMVALPLPIGLFFIWGGVMPKSADQNWIVWFEHAFYLPFGYAGLFALILSPRFFSVSCRWCVVILLVSVALSTVPGFPKHLPMMTLLHRISGEPTILDIIATAFSGLLMGMGLIFIVSLMSRVYQRRERSFYVFLALFSFFLLSLHSVVGVFTSRYVANAAVFFPLLMEDYLEFNVSALFRYSCGLILGGLSLASCLF